MTLQEIKQTKQSKVDALITASRMFFAFSDAQLKEGVAKYPLEAGDKLVSIRGGGFMPKSRVQAFLDGMDAINAEFKASTQDRKLRAAYILSELRNHEAFYTWDIDDTLESLGSDYSREEVQKVFDDHKEQEG